MAIDVNCTNPPESAATDAGVAGTGILLSFIITAAVALALSTSVIFREFRGKPSPIRRKVLNGYSDSQIMQGIGIQSVGLAKMDTLVPYHFFLIWLLSLLSMATHNATLLALVQDYRRDWVIRWMRQFLMFVNLVLSCVSGIFVLQSVTKGIEHKPVPIACVWHVGSGFSVSTRTEWVSYIGTIAVIAGNCVIFGLSTWYLHSREQRWYRTIQVVGMVIMIASAVGAAVRIGLLSQAFGNPTITLDDNGETEWSFGQLLSMLLLIYPLMSAVEIYRGEVEVAQPVKDEGQQLFDGELQANPRHHNASNHAQNQDRPPYQPNPFFGSETNLVRK